MSKTRFEVDADLITLPNSVKEHYARTLDQAAGYIGLSSDPFERELHSERYYLEFFYCWIHNQWDKKLLINVFNVNGRCVFEFEVHSTDFDVQIPRFYAEECLGELCF